jgi:hypothetical protein
VTTAAEIGKKPRISAGFAKDLLMMISDICRKCGKVLCVCLPLMAGVVIDSPPEEHCSAAPLCTERPLAMKPWSPDGNEPDYTTSPVAIEQVAETGGAATAADFPAGRPSNPVAASLPPPYRYRRGAHDSSWITPSLMLRLINTSA